MLGNTGSHVCKLSAQLGLHLCNVEESSVIAVDVRGLSGSDSQGGQRDRPRSGCLALRTSRKEAAKRGRAGFWRDGVSLSCLLAVVCEPVVGIVM